jgi:ribonuclease BN (tRNA processing enzyme)
MRVTVLGSGDAFASGGRRQSAYLVRSGERAFLLDAGPTVLAALHDAGESSGAIDFVLISHLHGDHFVGLVFMVMEYLFEVRRDREFLVIGPEGIEARVQDLFRAMYKETSQRPLTFPLRFQTVHSGTPVDLDGVRIEPFAVPHQTHEPSLGYRVTHEGKTVVYSGDSGWTDEFVHQTQGADLFLCECCYWDTKVDFHINYPDFEQNADRLGAHRVVLTHLGSEVLRRLGQMRVEHAYDGMVLDV